MKKIMLASDGSDCALAAAKFLAHLPHRDKLELTVLSVLVPPHTHRAMIRQDWIQLCLDQDREEANVAFRKIEELFAGANVTLKHAVLVGHAGRTIVDEAKALDCDLVVVGALGHSAIERILLGSTSDDVATHAHCSVLVVRPPVEPATHDALRVVIGYEESGPAQAAIEEFAEIDWGRQIDCHLVTVGRFADGFDPKVIEQLKSAAQRAKHALHAVAPQAQFYLIENEHVGEGLVRYAEGHQADLFIVGETPRNVVARALLGSVTRYVLRHAPCSVWITRNRVLHGWHEQTLQSTVIHS